MTEVKYYGVIGFGVCNTLKHILSHKLFLPIKLLYKM